MARVVGGEVSYVGGFDCITMFPLITMRIWCRAPYIENSMALRLLVYLSTPELNDRTATMSRELQLMYNVLISIS